jgi:outer membrane receptor protein involved in Fe transport
VTLTGSLLVQSGRPIICLGNNPADVNFGYLAAYYRCNGVVVPRGSQGFTPTMWNIDLGVNYSPSGFPGLSLQAKVFNVFNKHVATNLYPQGEQANVPGSGPVEPAFMSPVSYQAPRYVALTVEYKFGK